MEELSLGSLSNNIAENGGQSPRFFASLRNEMELCREHLQVLAENN